MASHGSVRVIVGSLLGNTAIFVFKLIVAIITGSGSMMAEAIHSLADCTNQILLLVGAREAQKPATAKHPLGRGRAAYFWSFMVALMIFLGGGVFSAYEGWHKLASHEPIENAYAAYAVLIVALVIEIAASLQVKRALDAQKEPGETFWQSLWHSKDADLVVLFAENTADVLGLALALFALLLAAFTGDPIYDAYGSIAIGILLCSASLGLTLKVKSLLQGESADGAVEELFRKEAAAHAHIQEVLTVLTIQQGPGQVMLAAKVRLAPGLSSEQVCRAINDLERRVKEQNPQVRWQFVEPDLVV
jgi:cation diffusion facilitator family transporter